MQYKLNHKFGEEVVGAWFNAIQLNGLRDTIKNRPEVSEQTHI
jgi:hypothetical protein